MKNFLLLSNYAPKDDYSYPGSGCAVEHRHGAHRRIQALQRFWQPENVEWTTLEVEKAQLSELMEEVRDDAWDAIWLSGSPHFLSEDRQPPWIKHALSVTEYLLSQDETPVIGLCFGLQLLARASGAQVVSSDHRYGQVDMSLVGENRSVPVAADHKNRVLDLPTNCQVLAESNCGMPYVVRFRKKILGIQPHPETDLVERRDREIAKTFWREQFLKVIAA